MPENAGILLICSFESIKVLFLTKLKIGRNCSFIEQGVTQKGFTFEANINFKSLTYEQIKLWGIATESNLYKSRRIINKCKWWYQYDLVCFEKVCEHFSGIENIIKEASRNLYTDIKEKYIEMTSKYGERVKEFNFDNQPYNFTYKDFTETNPSI